MATTCRYVFGEFEASEFFDPNDPESGEFFIGFKDCSNVSTGDLKCESVITYSTLHKSSQRELDYNRLYKYLEPDLLGSLKQIKQKSLIGKKSEFDLQFSIKSKWLIDYILLFKEELSQLPTVENYKLLFDEYKFREIEACYRKYGKSKYIKDLLNLLNIKDLINLNLNVYKFENNTPLLDPIYYIANI